MAWRCLTMRRASATDPGMRQRRAQQIHRSRACLPSVPLTEKTCRRPSLSRYARCSRGSVLAIQASLAC